MKKILLVLLSAFLIKAEKIYVDSALTSDSTATYNYATHGTDGSNGRCYINLQPALNYMTAGDSILIRGGTYHPSYRYILPADQNGTAWTSDSFNYIGSVPGEWAILDGQDSIQGSGWVSLIGNNTINYWMFERLEICNSKKLDGTEARGFHGDRGPFIFRYCYFHDNRCEVGSGNPCALGGHMWDQCLIEYCYFKNNGSESLSDNNCTHICMYGDYNHHTIAVDGFTWLGDGQHTARNEWRYNLIENGYYGMKMPKAGQLFCGRNPGGGHGYDDTYKDYCDKIHHNIIRNTRDVAIAIHQDFIQLYNNIIDSCGDGISMGAFGEIMRYKQCVYNNTVKRCQSIGIKTFMHYTDVDSEDAESMHYAFVFNNIVDSSTWIDTYDKEEYACGITNEMSGIAEVDSFNISHCFSYRPLCHSDDPTGVYMVRISPTRYTIATFQSSVKSDAILWMADYDSENPVWIGSTGASKYWVDPDYTLNADTTLSNGGRGGNHPFLSGITLPSYMGAVDPTGTDDTSWVSTVLSLVNLGADWESPLETQFDTVTWALSDTGKINVAGKQFYKRIVYLTSPSGYCKCYLLKDADIIDSSIVLSAGLDDTLSNEENGTGNDYKIYCRTARASE